LVGKLTFDVNSRHRVDARGGLLPLAGKAATIELNELYPDLAQTAAMTCISALLPSRPNGRRRIHVGVHRGTRDLKAAFDGRVPSICWLFPNAIEVFCSPNVNALALEDEGAAELLQFVPGQLFVFPPRL
jgi:hypothetical protein